MELNENNVVETELDRFGVQLEDSIGRLMQKRLARIEKGWWIFPLFPRTRRTMMARYWRRVCKILDS